ncbi:MAG: endonuclease/exonuclease/phosphatase family protein [Oscillospiraceae bacterium]|nr:endonuclease/exonuclease/phosphatase family protein [Oscillospiraceae bacterium]
MKKKVLKYTAIGVGAVLALVVLFVAGYIIYMQANYYRIADNTALTVTQNQTQTLQQGQAYTALTYNIGFGAYNPDFSFFMDSGTMLDGTEVTGVNSRAQSAQIAQGNTDGALAAIQAQNADFCLLQEVDEKATRSFNINQVQQISAAMQGYGSVFANNFHASYMLYPFHEPHGSVQAGLLTLSRYSVSEAVRRSYPVDVSFFTKFFDLDRAFAVLRLPVENGKELVLINSHMSAYDKGGTVRVRQLKLLNDVMAEEYEKGNYVIVGGDFNHALAGTVNAFETQQQVPAWVYVLESTDLASGFRVVAGTNAPTCRSTDIPYTKGVNYTTVLDGFIVSDNITATAENIDTDFAYSDHNPALLTFTLQ